MYIHSLIFYFLINLFVYLRAVPGEPHPSNGMALILGPSLAVRGSAPKSQILDKQTKEQQQAASAPNEPTTTQGARARLPPTSKHKRNHENIQPKNQNHQNHSPKIIKIMIHERMWIRGCICVCATHALIHMRLRKYAHSCMDIADTRMCKHTYGHASAQLEVRWCVCFQLCACMASVWLLASVCLHTLASAICIHDCTYLR